MKDLFKKIEARSKRKRPQRIVLDVTPEMHESLFKRLAELKGLGLIITTTEFVRSISPAAFRQLFSDTFGEISSDSWKDKELPGDVEIVLRSKAAHGEV